MSELETCLTETREELAHMQVGGRQGGGGRQVGGGRGKAGGRG